MFSILVAYVAVGIVYGFGGLSIDWTHPYVDLLIGIEIFVGAVIWIAWDVAKYNERYGCLPKTKEFWLSGKW